MVALELAILTQKNKRKANITAIETIHNYSASLQNLTFFLLDSKIGILIASTIIWKVLASNHPLKKEFQQNNKRRQKAMNFTNIQLSLKQRIALPQFIIIFFLLAVSLLSYRNMTVMGDLVVNLINN